MANVVCRMADGKAVPFHRLLPISWREWGHRRAVVRRGDQDRRWSDQEMVCGNSLERRRELCLPPMPGFACSSRKTMAWLVTAVLNADCRPCLLSDSTCPDHVGALPSVKLKLCKRRSPKKGDRSEGVLRRLHPSVSRVGKSNSWSSTRLIISTGLFVSAFLLLVAYLDRKPHNLAIFGGLTVIFFILNLRMLRQR